MLSETAGYVNRIKTLEIKEMNKYRVQQPFNEQTEMAHDVRVADELASQSIYIFSTPHPRLCGRY